MTSIPSESQLLLPALEIASQMGGAVDSEALGAAVAAQIGVSAAERSATSEVDCGAWGTRRRSPWRMTWHRLKYRAALAGLIEPHQAGYWRLTEKARHSLVKCGPGVIVTVYETPSGEVVWADAITAAGAVADGALNLLFTSPPYPLPGKGRKYGNLSPTETVELIVKCAHEWRRGLADDGSVVLNFRDVWLPMEQTGGATRSIYQEKILTALVEDVKLFFADRLFWKNPVCMGDPWVTIRHVRTTMNCEQLFWFSKTPNPKADNRRVLVPAAASTIATYKRKALTGQRNVIGPSGYNNICEEQIAAVQAGETLNVIPRNVLEFANSDPKTVLHAKLNELCLPRHDATMPPKLAEFFIKFLTEPDNLVADPFSGSGTTLHAAHRLGRRFIGGDSCLAHVLGSAVRFLPSELRFLPAGSA